MKRKPLKETNPYLKDPLLREEMILRSVISSSAVEGIRPLKEDMARLKELARINREKFLTIRRKCHPHHIPTP
jgi:hypothetical protein